MFLRMRPISDGNPHVVLIANHRAGDTDPRERGEIFGTATTQVREQLEASGHGAISTFDLFRLLRLVQRGEVKLTAAAVLKLLRTEGLLNWESYESQLRAPAEDA